MLVTNPSTESLIKEAARRVFTAKGFAATRTEDIAVEAGVNKALVNYYYRSKHLLFEAIFQEEMQEMMQNMNHVLSNPDYSIFEKIRRLIDFDFDLLLRNPGLPIFVLSEIAHNPELVGEKHCHQSPVNIFGLFQEQIRQEIREGNIIDVDPMQLWMDLVSLVMMPFAAKPLLIQLFQLDEQAFWDLMRARRQHVAELIIGNLQRQ